VHVRMHVCVCFSLSLSLCVCVCVCWEKTLLRTLELEDGVYLSWAAY